MTEPPAPSTASWIRTIGPGEAEGRLADIYSQIAGPSRQVDNILQVHSLRPHTLLGHLGLYKAVLHHNKNTLGNETLELLGVFVSSWNGCEYCREHHFEGLRRLLQDENRAAAIRRTLLADSWEADFPARERELLRYAHKLTRHPDQMVPEDLTALRQLGFDDGEILEANQVIAYFQYANRTVTGLGVSHVDETLGLAPSNTDDETDWGHR
jgi:uncharacterized peroxidase-related enzyme